MSTYYCSTCGKAIQYAVTKPSSCPGCGKLIKAVSALVAAGMVIIPVPPTETHYQVVVPGQKGKTAKRYNVIPEPKGLSRARIMEEDLADGAALGEGDTPDSSGEGDDNDDGAPLNEAYDVNAAKQLARELVAGIDPSTIHVGNDDDDKPVKFGDLVRQREAQMGKQ